MGTKAPHNLIQLRARQSVTEELPVLGPWVLAHRPGGQAQLLPQGVAAGLMGVASRAGRPECRGHSAGGTEECPSSHRPRR